MRARVALAAAAIAAVLFLLPLGLGDYWSYQLALYYLYAIAALGLGLCWGRAGFLPLGMAGAAAALAAAFVNAAFGLCLGCEMYVLIHRIWPGQQGAVPPEPDKEVAA